MFILTVFHSNKPDYDNFRILKILQQKCTELKIDLKVSQGLSKIQSLRHLTMKKVTSVSQDDSAVDNMPFGMMESDMDQTIEF